MLPKLISIGSFFIPTYGTLVALGFLAALWIITRLAKRASLPSELITNLAIYCALAGLAGAKLFMILFDFGDLLERPPAAVFAGNATGRRRLSRRLPGRVRYGRFSTCAVSICPSSPPAIFSRPALRSGQAIGRIGCFSAGCCWGIATHVPWAITFHNPRRRMI